jgi:dihydroxy-acid dehydratase
MSDKKPTLRSAQWFGTADKNGFMYRSWMKNQGIADHQFHGKPIIGICNTWSELTPCNAHFRQIAEHVKRGVIEAGGFPVEFPVFSNGESNLRPPPCSPATWRAWTWKKPFAATRLTAWCC